MVLRLPEAGPRWPSAIALRAGPSLADDAFADVRRRAIVRGCKWDPQVGDVSTLSSFPLLLGRRSWQQLARLSESLAREAMSAESEILERAELVDRLGLPRSIRAALHPSALDPTPALVRVMRFDFHPTRSGWQISEVNSDVPGGFSEASYFTELMAGHYPAACLVPNPALALVDAIVDRVGQSAQIALLAAPGYLEDQQVMAFLGRLLDERGARVHLASPAQLRWRSGAAELETSWYRGPLDAVVRFFQVEWLARLPKACWQPFFRGGRTPVLHPGSAALSESKRFPLVWPELRTRLDSWRLLLPESRDPREAPWNEDPGWILKLAMSNTGDDVCMRELCDRRTWQSVRWDVRMRPSAWVAQKRFESIALPTPLGPRHACLGVYTVNGRATGVYGRLSPRPLVDFAATDVAVLLVDDE